MISLANEQPPASVELIPAAAETPAPKHSMVSRVIYGAGYYVSFSVALPAFFAVNLLPRESAIRRGCRAGADDAAATSQRVQDCVASAANATCEKVGGAYSCVAAGVAERVEAVQDRMAERKYRRRIATA